MVSHSIDVVPFNNTQYFYRLELIQPSPCNSCAGCDMTRCSRAKNPHVETVKYLINQLHLKFLSETK
jgi:hypothetical protein